ncbi:hypothetical protein GN956_G23182 [Arapaima gigas]
MVSNAGLESLDLCPPLNCEFLGGGSVMQPSSRPASRSESLDPVGSSPGDEIGDKSRTRHTGGLPNTQRQTAHPASSSPSLP